MWFKKEKLIIVQNHRESTYTNPSIFAMKLSDLLKDIGVDKVDEIKHESHQICNYHCRIIYNKGYYTSYIDALRVSDEFNHHVDVDLKFDDPAAEGIVRTFKTRSFVLNELHNKLAFTVAPATPSAPPPDS
jgi:hypothetical protein